MLNSTLSVPKVPEVLGVRVPKVPEVLKVRVLGVLVLAVPKVLGCGCQGADLRDLATSWT